MSDQPVPVAPRPPAPGRSAFGILVIVSVVGVLLLATGAVATWFVLKRMDKPKVDEASFLEVDLSGALSDVAATPSLFGDPNDFPPTTSEIATAIRHAATDERITGLYLKLDGVNGGWASFQELRGAVEAFEGAGKPCVAYSPSVLENGSYFLATACSTIAVAPPGVMLVNGLSVNLTYYKGTFDKLGIVPEFEHVGAFKSYIESYERTGPSEPAAQAYDALLDSLFGQLVDGIARGRHLTPEQVQAAIDLPTLSPTIAKSRGLIDALAWPDAMDVHVHQVRQADWLTLLDKPVSDEDAKDAKLTQLDEYLKDLRADEDSAGPRVAVINAQGSIVSGDDKPSLFGDSGNLTDGAFSKWMEAARKDKDVKAVVVRVNSPGGSALAASLMWREVARTKAVGKPVVISMGDYAASGGYMMSANADWIVAQPGTLTGSIGVFGGKFDLSGVWEKLGMTQHAFSRGRMANLMSFDAPFDDAERAVFREYLADFYGQFIGVVADGRKMTREAVDEVAQGRVWTGQQALERHLVDQLGGLDVAVAEAAKRANLTTIVTKPIPARQTFIEHLMEGLEDSSAGVHVTIDTPFSLTEEQKAELSVLEHVSAEGGAAAYLPGRLTVK